MPLMLEFVVLRPALQHHLSDLAQEPVGGSDMSSDVQMGDSIVLPDAVSFEEVNGDVGYVDAIRVALSEDRYVELSGIIDMSTNMLPV
jgi:hypothetical protein